MGGSISTINLIPVLIMLNKKSYILSRIEMKWLIWAIVINSIYSVAIFSIYHYHNPYIELIVNLVIIFLALNSLYKSNIYKNSNFYIVNIYFIWMVAQSLRGLIGCEMYMDYRQLIDGMVMLSLPILVYLFYNPHITGMVLRYWMKFGLLAFLLFIVWDVGFTSFYLAPIYLFACFFSDLPKKWKIVIFIILAVWFSKVLDRAQLMRTIMVSFIALGFYYKKFINKRVFKIIHLTFYVTPLVFLLLGYLGTFNILSYMSNEKEYKTTITTKSGEEKFVNVMGDTRTFIYTDVLASALKHNYFLCGRTPARGNDTSFFGNTSDDGKGHKMRLNERHSNELVHTNVFTWIGVIGLLLYSLIYLRASTLALFKSNNQYIKFLGIFIAFRWTLGWIEDFNSFFILSISLWMMIAMCFSAQFRKMNDTEFKYWLLNCLPK